MVLNCGGNRGYIMVCTISAFKTSYPRIFKTIPARASMNFQEVFRD